MAFTSTANTFDPAADPDENNIFRKDRTTGTVELVSRAPAPTVPAPRTSPVQPRSARTAIWSPSCRREAGSRRIPTPYTDVYIRNLTTDVTTLASPGTGERSRSSTSPETAIRRLHVADAPGRWRSERSPHRCLPAQPQLGRDRPRLEEGSLRQRRATPPRTTVRSAATDVMGHLPIGGNRPGHRLCRQQRCRLPDVYVRDMNGPTNYLVSSRGDNALQGANGEVADPSVPALRRALATVKVVLLRPKPPTSTSRTSTTTRRPAST